MTTKTCNTAWTFPGLLIHDEGKHREALAGIGVTLDDQLYRKGTRIRAHLPEGWTYSADVHRYDSKFVDAKGNTRALLTVMDHEGLTMVAVHTITRYIIVADRNDQGQVLQCVRDNQTGEMVFWAEAEKKTGDMMERIKQRRDDCAAWLAEQGFPDHENPAAYWE